MPHRRPNARACISPYVASDRGCAQKILIVSRQLGQRRFAPGIRCSGASKRIASVSPSSPCGWLASRSSRQLLRPPSQKLRRAAFTRFASEGWCPWRESNPHSLRNTILSRARLPVPPHGLRAPSISSASALGKRKSPCRGRWRVRRRPCNGLQDQHIAAHREDAAARSG
jgi:hypothetical protein